MYIIRRGASATAENSLGDGVTQNEEPRPCQRIPRRPRSPGCISVLYSRHSECVALHAVHRDPRAKTRRIVSSKREYEKITTVDPFHR